jgi:hypothetical protein
MFRCMIGQLVLNLDTTVYNSSFRSEGIMNPLVQDRSETLHGNSHLAVSCRRV